MLDCSSIEKPAALWVRPLASTDMRDIIEHLLRLSPYDRYLRFFCTLSDKTVRSLIVDRLKDDYVYSCGVYRRDRLIGVGQLAATAETPECAELAVSVDANSRNEGVATELIRHMISHARRQRYHEISLSMMSENIGIKRLARRFAFQFRHENGQIAAYIRIDPAD